MNKIYCTDALVGLKKLESNSIDCIITDPPYGLEFMGKKWDKAVPPVEIWKECYRVLKHGAFAFVMCIPRQDCLSKMISNLNKAGFETGFTSIYWTYASGFPKAQNISKTVDKRACKRELTERLGRKPTKKEFDEAWKDFRKKVGEVQWIDGSIRQALSKKATVDYAGGWKGTGYGLPITEPKTKKAKELDGSFAGFQPKPAVEVILVVMKSLSEKSYTEQAMKNKKGITWLDDCRVPYKKDETPTIGGRHKIDGRRIGTGDSKFGFKSLDNPTIKKGRFPANLLVSDEILDNGKTRKSSDVGFESVGWKHSGGKKDKMTPLTKREGTGYGDSGSYSRFFDLDAWFEEKIKFLPKEVKRTFPFMIIPKASKSEKNEGLENLPDKLVGMSGGARQALKKGKKKYLEGHIGLNIIRKVKNTHPTCKPIKLMDYLITLGSRIGDVVLDPFIGSGTTALACIISGRRYIGFDINQEYVDIANARIKAMKKQSRLFEWSD